MFIYDFSELDDYIDKLLDILSPEEMDIMLMQFVAEEGQRLVGDTKKLTPIDSGDLRRNWQLGKVQRVGKVVQVEMVNNLNYAAAVEYGHRTRNYGYVEGRRMMTVSLKRIEEGLPGRLQQRLQQIIDEV